MGEIKLLLGLMDEAFEKKAWHGPNLRGSIRGLSARQAARRPAPGRHNIWEIVVHAAYWKYAARRRLTGGKPGSFPVRGSNWFVRPQKGGERAWRKDIALLVDEHRRLRRAVAATPASTLKERPAGSRYTMAAIIGGIVSHDLYHAGQIQLLKRLSRA
jgi:hypothetical protein